MESVIVLILTITLCNLIKGSEVVSVKNIMFLILSIVLVILNAIIKDKREGK